jgi:hypothetical protein
LALGKDEPEKVEDLVKPNLDAIKEKVIVVALIDRDFDRAHSLPQAGPYLEAFSKAVFPDGYVAVMPKTPTAGSRSGVKRKASSGGSGSTPRATRRRLADQKPQELSKIVDDGTVNRSQSCFVCLFLSQNHCVVL